MLAWLRRAVQEDDKFKEKWTDGREDRIANWRNFAGKSKPLAVRSHGSAVAHCVLCRDQSVQSGDGIGFALLTVSTSAYRA